MTDSGTLADRPGLRLSQNSSASPRRRRTSPVRLGRSGRQRAASAADDHQKEPRRRRDRFRHHAAALDRSAGKRAAVKDLLYIRHKRLERDVDSLAWRGHRDFRCRPHDLDEAHACFRDEAMRRRPEWLGCRARGGRNDIARVPWSNAGSQSSRIEFRRLPSGPSSLRARWFPCQRGSRRTRRVDLLDHDRATILLACSWGESACVTM